MSIGQLTGSLFPAGGGAGGLGQLLANPQAIGVLQDWGGTPEQQSLFTPQQQGQVNQMGNAWSQLFNPQTVANMQPSQIAPTANQAFQNMNLLNPAALGSMGVG